MRLKVYDHLLASYFSWLVVLYPILTMYSIFHVKLEYIAIMIGVLMLCVRGYKASTQFIVEKSVILFFGYMIIMPSLIFKLIENSEGALFQTGTILFFLVLTLITITADPKLLWRYYFIIFWIALVIFFLQEISWYTLGRRFSALIPGLDFSFYGEGGGAEMAEFQKNTNRSCSIFMEPAVFAKFLIPAVIYNLKYTKKSYIRLFGLICVFLLLRSGVGFILLATCQCIYIFNLPIKRKSIKGISIACITGIIVISGMVISTTEYGEVQLARMEEVNAENVSSSGFLRVIRGYLLYDGMNTLEKIVGIGSKNIGFAIQSSPYAYMFDGVEDVYLNGIQALLVGGGVIGVVLFIFMIRDIGNRRSIISIGILSCILMSFFVAAEYLSATMLLFLSIAILERKYSQKSVHIYNNGLQNFSRFS